MAAPRGDRRGYSLCNAWALAEIEDAQQTATARGASACRFERWAINALGEIVHGAEQWRATYAPPAPLLSLQQEQRPAAADCPFGAPTADDGLFADVVADSARAAADHDAQWQRVVATYGAERIGSVARLVTACRDAGVEAAPADTRCCATGAPATRRLVPGAGDIDEHPGMDPAGVVVCEDVYEAARVLFTFRWYALVRADQLYEWARQELERERSGERNMLIGLFTTGVTCASSECRGMHDFYTALASAVARLWPVAPPASAASAASAAGAYAE